MSRKLSDRAQRYLQTFTRRPHVSDLKLVRKALKEAGVPVTQAVLNFHETFAGPAELAALEAGRPRKRQK